MERISRRCNIYLINIILIFVLFISSSNADIVDSDDTLAQISLEQRALSINGTVYQDLNSNGVKDNEELGLVGWTVKLFMIGSDVERRSIVTDRFGKYAFDDLEPGNYVVEEEIQNGWNLSPNGRESIEVTLVDKSIFDINFGNLIKEHYISNITTVMHISPEKIQEEQKIRDNLTKAYLSPEIKKELEGTTAGQAFDLWVYLPIVAAERNQGSCGNCWVWASTGLMEIDNSVQNSLHGKRFSIQYFSSNYGGGSGCNFDCCGGFPRFVANYYRNVLKKTIPWSSTIDFKDRDRCCSEACPDVKSGCGIASSSTNVAAASIPDIPNYALSSIADVPIPTTGVSKENAIKAIKNVLMQKKAVVFGFYQPISSSSFFDHWDNEDESKVWTPDQSKCGKSSNKWGHALLCVGFDDSDPSNRYWIMVNSWGITSKRPNGIVLVSMDLNYDCTISGNKAFQFDTFNIKWNKPPQTPATPAGKIAGTVGTSYRYTTYATDPNNDQVKYTFDWGDGKPQTTTSLVASGATSGLSHIWSAAGSYLVKAKAADSKGAASEWSSIRTVTITGVNGAPATPAIPSGSSSGTVGASYPYTTYATDPNNDQVKYTFDWGDGKPQTTTSLVASGATSGLPHIWSAAGSYLVKAKATDSKGAASGWSSARTVTITGVNGAPATPAIPSGSSSGTVGASYPYTTYATDPNNDQVKYTFDWGDGKPQTTTSLVASGATSGLPHIWSAAGSYLVKAKATDSKGAASGWSSARTVTITGVNGAPATPAIPSGSSAGTVGASYPYTTYATDPNNDQVKYTFDWGDNTPQTTTSLVASGATAGLSHLWSAAGSYLVKAKATDSKGASSGWSSARTVTLTGNSCGADRAPTVPSPNGPTSGSSGISYLYSAVANDPDAGDQVQYTFDWADGTPYTTTQWVTPGTSASASHSWTVPTGYTTKFNIRAKATDKCGKSSDWTYNPLSVTITAPGEPTTVYFTVISTWSGAQISGALIQVTDGAGNSKQATTNSAGMATISGISGTWGVTVSKSGYYTLTLPTQTSPPTTYVKMGLTPVGVSTSLKKSVVIKNTKDHQVQLAQEAEELLDKAAQRSQDLRNQARREHVGNLAGQL